MTGMDGHAKPPARRDHLWVLFIIAACALLELVASWVTIGAMSGFPTIGGKHGLPTDWTLAVTTEAYWAYALYSWLDGAPGPRSRRFAMWSAVAVFILSLTGQGAAHLVKPGTQPSPVLVVFVTSLPVVVLASVAVLIHLRQLDREEAAEAVRLAEEAERQAAIERAEADERTALRAALEAVQAEREAGESELRTALETAQAELETARTELAKAVAKTETLTRKLGGNGGRKPARKPTGNGTRKPAGTTGRKEPGATAPEGTPEETADLDAEARVLQYLAEGMSASEAGRKAGLSDSRGRQIARKLAKAAPADTVDGGESGQA